MKYNAVAFLEGLFRHAGGMAVGDDPDLSADARADATVTVADLSPDWHLQWDERAAIMEYDGGLPREHAEAQALAEIIVQMRRSGDLPQS
jgi:hypothetical protein